MKEPFQTGDELTDFILRITHEIWEEGQVFAINNYYGKDVIVRSPSGVTTGCQSVIDSTYVGSTGVHDADGLVAYGTCASSSMECAHANFTGRLASRSCF